jgi:hypothetical protein
MLSSQQFEILSRQIYECAVRIYPSIFRYFVIRFYTFDWPGWGRGALDTIWTAHLSNFFVLIPFFICFLSSWISSALSCGNPTWCQRCNWGATPACLLSCSSSSTSVESISGWTSTFHLPHGCDQALSGEPEKPLCAWWSRYIKSCCESIDWPSSRKSHQPRFSVSLLSGDVEEDIYIVARFRPHCWTKK